MIETVLRREFIACAIRAFPDRVRLYTRNVGVFKLADGRFFHAAVKGQADVCGYFRGKDNITRPIEIEIKRPRTPTTDEQIQWAEHCRRWLITYLLLTEVKDEPDVVSRFVKELGEAINNA
jgi:hypothetical protein